MANVTNIEIRAEDKTRAAFRKVNSGLTKLDKNLKSTNKNMGFMTGGFSKMAGMMGGVIGVAAITGFAKNILTIGDRLQKVSLQLGIAVEKLEIYQFAASQSGVGTEALNKSLQKFTRSIGEAGAGMALPTDAFENLGISIYDAAGSLKGTPELFEEVATAIAKIESPAEKARIASDLFGRSGVELLPLLNAGAKGIENYGNKLRDAGGIIGGEAADAMAVFNDKIDTLSLGLRGKFAPALVAILPALTLLADNLDNIAKFAAIAATAFIAAKIPVLLGAISTGVVALTLAIAANPIGAIAVAITALGTAAFAYSDDIADFFGFAEDAPEDLKKTNKELDKTEGILKDLAKVEVKRTKIAEKFVKTSKIDIIPNLKLLEEGLGATKIEFVNLAGREGLGGIQLAFRSFFMSVWSDAKFYLGGTSSTIKKNFSNMKQDFEEFFMALDNIVIFEGNDVKNAFSAVMRNLEKQVKTLEIQVGSIVIDVPASAFSFLKTIVPVPANIFDVSQIPGTQAKLDALVKQINSYTYSTTSRTASRLATAYTYTNWNGFAHVGGPYWDDDMPMIDALSINSEILKMPIPSVSINGSSASASPASFSASPASRNASRGGGGTGVEVNIYDGTGQKISEYDSSIRVQITERASRNNQFPALE